MLGYAASRHSPGGPTEHSAADGTSSYLRSISRVPVLSRAEQLSLAEEMVRHRDAFLDDALGWPVLARAVVRRWRERQEHGHATGSLSTHYGSRPVRDRSGEIDRALASVERRLARGSRRPDAAAAARRTRELAAAMRRAELSFDVLVQAYRESERELSSQGGSRPADPERARLARARAALERYEHSKQRFIQHNLKLVVKFSKLYRGMGVGFLDLIQEGNLGLIRAVEKFEPQRGHAFSTYAAWWIHQALIRGVQKNSRTVRAPSNVYDLERNLRRAEEKLRVLQAEEPGRTDVAHALELQPADVDPLAFLSNAISSIHAPLAGADSLTLEDTLAAPDVAEPCASRDHAVIGSSLASALDELAPRERMIVEFRFGLQSRPAETLHQVGLRLGLSRERVRQIEMRALKQLRHSSQVTHLANAVS